ncbi:YdcF family protein [Guptibacillus algicola]|uniref:YdcF family protein n=1 Tax=Guptibacillus algicola TaxID=225844 RepID=UPI001CD1BB6A|nr:YdcF family protein [Alkalihalobacillus algicola]MCA0987030.1 YdcF family protein [Alkalihalobacillus algicola]
MSPTPIVNKTKKLSTRNSVYWLIVFAIPFFFLLFAGRWLVIDQQAKQADVIFVLSGGEGRVDKGLTLIEQGFSNKIVLTNARGFSAADFKRVNDEITYENVYTDYESTSTLASAKYSKELMQSEDMTSALIVSSDYHMRRTKLIYDRTFNDGGIELTFISTESDYLPERWWADKYSIGVTGSEYIKLIGNFIGIHGAFAKRQLYKFESYFFS